MKDAPQTTIIAVNPKDIRSIGMELTKTMKNSLLKVETLVKKEIENLGIKLYQKNSTT